jgi:hypothetical protein
MNHAEEATKIARDVKFTVLGRALADRVAEGENADALIAQAVILRRIEQDSADKATRFAGLARQVGDAARNGKETQPILDKLVELRRIERTGE